MRIFLIALIISIISGAFWIFNHKEAIDPVSSSDKNIELTPVTTNTLNPEPIITTIIETPAPTVDSNQPFKGPSIEVDEKIYGNGPSIDAGTTSDLIAPEDSVPN